MIFKDKRAQLCFSLLGLMVLAGVGSVRGQEPSADELLPIKKQEFIQQYPELTEKIMLVETYPAVATVLSAGSNEQPFRMAKADTDKIDEEESLTPECMEWRKDPDADIGVMLRAGCQPTIGQMSALMDNPLGNVAMLFFQFDISKLENPTFDESDWKYNYMGIAQFPKGLGKNWNIINRIVWNVPSMPVDQGKIDDAADRLERQLGSGEGPIVIAPPDAPIAPIDLFSGRTTGFGDMYYNGLFSPKKGYKTEGGGSLLWGLGFDLGFPTATEDILGTGKWLAGPSGLGVYLGRKWKIGALVQHYWDYAGDSDRDDLNVISFQPFGGYGFAGDKALEHVGPFSGGEKSRLVLALLVYQRPNLLLLDEPTAGLDPRGRRELMAVMASRPETLLVSTHDLAMVAETLPRTLKLRASSAAKGPPCSRVSTMLYWIWANVQSS